MRVGFIGAGNVGTGGCPCGQVRYSANADPALVGVCHCTHCQKQMGTAFPILL
jgi:hypothetical protein